MTLSAISRVHPVDVLTLPGLTMAEYFGRASSGDEQLSACLATVPTQGEEAHQLLEFDEYVIVVSGELWVAHSSQTFVIVQGEGLLLRAGARVLWRWPKPCKL
mmetsp:Transcript_1928/g.4251  ORF Transcript_1928/g.4251 Transcript_1928/m.4251 type:complete len:103 (+) Transcript_1928:31-339(+)